MIRDRRVLAYVIIALIVGAALAVAVALAQSSGSAAGTTLGAASGEASVQAVYSESGDAALAPADPAKEEPLLDKFTSKDPFIPFGTPSTPTPNPTSTSNPKTDLSAKIKVDGTTYNVMQGDKVPGGSAAEFTITSVTSGDVSFGVIDGALKNGDTSFSVNLGESVRVTLDGGVSYDISVISIGGSGSQSGHSITVLSVTMQNGTAMATFEVDGKTYSDKKVGDVFSTSWGEIEVLAIDVNAQTVTILHGDQTIVLHVGQVIIK